MHDFSTEINNALAADPYEYNRVISALMTWDDLSREYLSENSKKHPYSIREHTMMVCNLFERYFVCQTWNFEFSLRSFRLLLCLHDIGKPRANREGKKQLQHEYSVRIWEELVPLLNIDTKEQNIGSALISDDPIGLYIRQKIEVNEASLRIINMCKNTQISTEQFLKLLTILYQVDSASYIRQAFLLSSKEFVDKPKIETIYSKDSSCEIIYDNKLSRFRFTKAVEETYQILSTTVAGKTRILEG